MICNSWTLFELLQETLDPKSAIHQMTFKSYKGYKVPKSACYPSILVGYVKCKNKFQIKRTILPFYTDKFEPNNI